MNVKTPQQTAARALEIYSEKFRSEFGAKPLHVEMSAVEILIAGAIEADRLADALYDVTIESAHTGQQYAMRIDVRAGESIVDATIREGDAPEEWNLIDAQRVIR